MKFADLLGLAFEALSSAFGRLLGGPKFGIFS